LNGKLIVELVSVDSADTYIYMMPNKFSDDFRTHGILENNMVYAKKTG